LKSDEPKPLEIGSFAAHSTRGVIRDRKARRVTMLLSMALALLLLGCAVVIDAHEHLLVAVLCWFACAWMTVIVVLLALYDLLVLRREARAQREQLQRQFREN
jgi:predicted MFS family arabinose efflux permease